jgi:alkaline phosphatase
MNRAARACKIFISAFLFPFLLLSCTPSQSPVATHIILFMGDGMQLEHEIAGSRYLYGNDSGLAWQSWTDQSYVTTWDVTTYNAYAADAGSPLFDESTFAPLLGYDPSFGGYAPYPVDTIGTSAYLLRAATDSAAASTAMATGVKTDAGNIAWKRGDPAVGSIATIAELIRERKSAAIGVVTTVPFNHATPAAFVSHTTSRTNYSDIASQILSVTRPDVVIGGGHPGWNTTYFSIAELAAAKMDPAWTVVERSAGIDGGTTLISAVSSLTAGGHLFGLFGGVSGDFELPQPANAPVSPSFLIVHENPSLAEEVNAALTVLSKNANGLFLMAEQGTIDHANHANDFAGMVGGVYDLDKAVRAAEAYIDQPGDDLTWNNTLVVVTADHGNSLMHLSLSAPLGAGALPMQVATVPWTYPGGVVTYGTTGHTNELVTLAARGAGAYLFTNRQGSRYPGTKIMDNTDIFNVLMQAAGLP